MRSRQHCLHRHTLLITVKYPFRRHCTKCARPPIHYVILQKTYPRHSLHCHDIDTYLSRLHLRLRLNSSLQYISRRLILLGGKTNTVLDDVASVDHMVDVRHMSLLSLASEPSPFMRCIYKCTCEHARNNCVLAISAKNGEDLGSESPARLRQLASSASG